MLRSRPHLSPRQTTTTINRARGGPNGHGRGGTRNHGCHAATLSGPCARRPLRCGSGCRSVRGCLGRLTRSSPDSGVSTPSRLVRHVSRGAYEGRISCLKSTEPAGFTRFTSPSTTRAWTLRLANDGRVLAPIAPRRFHRRGSPRSSSSRCIIRLPLAAGQAPSGRPSQQTENPGYAPSWVMS